MSALWIGALAAFLVRAPAAQEPASLQLVLPDTAKPVRAPVTVLVWRLSHLPDTAIWSFRVGDQDVSSRVVRRAREFLVALPPGAPLGAGEHRLSGDVCTPHGWCASADVKVAVLPPDGRGSDGGDAKETILKAIVEILRRLLSGDGG